MASSKPQPGKSLAETHPELAAQADGWDPTTVTAGRHVKLRWRCKSGHEWDADVASRTYSGRGCPYCAGKVAIPGENDLMTVNPGLASEVFGWDPTKYKAFSNKSMQWKCPSDHIWTAQINERSAGNGCPYCSNKSVLQGFNDLSTTHPDLAKQAHGWDPTTVISGSHKKFEWICELGHVWISAVQNRKRGSGCSICSGQKVQVGYNDFATEFPELAKEAFGWDPSTVTRSSGRKKVWKCEHGHKWLAPPHARTIGSGCPTCAGKRVGVGFNDLATTHTELAREAHDWNPTTVVAGSGMRKKWKCHRNHVWTAVVSSRAMAGNGCPYCSGDKVLAGFNDLKTLQPTIAAEAYDWDPTTVVTQSGTLQKWKCSQGHIFSQRVAKRTNGQGCPTCGNKNVLVGFNDLATIRPDLAAQAVGWDPKTVIAGAATKKRWKCDNQHEWITTVDARMSKGTGCPSCAASGFDPNQPGYLYLIDHFELQMFQIGISNFPEDRLGDHKRRGWEVLELRGPMDGHHTQQLETSCLHALEKRGAILGHKAGIKKFDGYTEAWTKQSLNETSIKQILDWVYEDEAK